MNNAIVIHVGGDGALERYKRIHAAGREPFLHTSGNISIAANADCRTRHGNHLLVAGTPLPDPFQTPGSFPGSFREVLEYLVLHDGVFNMFYWDEAAGKLVICTDFLGLQPLYRKAGRDGLFFSSHTRVFGGGYDPAGWGAFLTLGYTLGNTTLTAGVERVPPGSIIVVDAASGQTDHHQYYWRLEDVEPGRASASLGDVYDTLRESMEKAISASRFPHVLLMSGGFDSRLIACMLTEKKQPFSAVLVSHYDENLDAESRFALAMAKKLGFSCVCHRPPQDFFSSPAYLDYVFESDSEIPSLYLFIAQVFQYVPCNATVWDGLLPGATLNLLPFPFNGRELFSGEGGAFFRGPRNGGDSGAWQAARTIFTGKTADAMFDAFREAWKKEAQRHLCGDHEESAARFLLGNRVRNRTGPNPFKVYHRNAQLLTPGMTRDYVACSMAVPAGQKENHRLYRDLFRSCFPEALVVPLVHGNTIERPERFSVGFEMFSAVNHLHRALNKRPRLMRRLGFLGVDPEARGFKPSAFLEAEDLWKEDDPALDYDFLLRLRRGEEVPAGSKELLFHWRAWRCLRNGEGRNGGQSKISWATHSRRVPRSSVSANTPTGENAHEFLL